MNSYVLSSPNCEISEVLKYTHTLVCITSGQKKHSQRKKLRHILRYSPNFLRFTVYESEEGRAEHYNNWKRLQTYIGFFCEYLALSYTWVCDA